MTTHKRYWIIFVALLMAPFSAVQAMHEDQHHLMFFLSGGPTYHQITSEDGIQENDFFLDADIMYSYVNGDFRFLAEYVLSTEESELERFMLGWQADEDIMGWIGRFHSPSRYWNITYHHGQYLQTSVTRPLVEKFEDEGGILPAHVTGLMVDAMHKLPGAVGFQTVFSIGTTSVIGDHELVSFDLLDSRSKQYAMFSYAHYK